jgi:hypothetical protein
MATHTWIGATRRSRVALGMACLAISSAVITLVVGCNSCDLPQFEPGTRFLVTVQNDESVCSGTVNFSAGETFEVVAGNARRSPGDACEYTSADGVPDFRDSQYEFVGCQGNSVLGLECSVRLPDCPDADLFLYFADVPEGRSKISTTYYFNVHGGEGCDTTFPGCFQAIPVTIERP